jgi:hypothetical protein
VRAAVGKSFPVAQTEEISGAEWLFSGPDTFLRQQKAHGDGEILLRPQGDTTEMVAVSGTWHYHERVDHVECDIPHKFFPNTSKSERRKTNRHKSAPRVGGAVGGVADVASHTAASACFWLPDSQLVRKASLEILGS